VLAHLFEAPERRLQMIDLAEKLKITRSRLTYAVTRLEKDGWVRREDCPGDNRGQLSTTYAISASSRSASQSNSSETEIARRTGAIITTVPRGRSSQRSGRGDASDLPGDPHRVRSGDRSFGR
jgi:predicted transcriptional regulator